jgi:hypothetical protein
MEVGEAVVISAYQGPEGDQEVEFKAVCSAANGERLNGIAGEWRAAVTLDPGLTPTRRVVPIQSDGTSVFCNFGWATTSSWSFSIPASRRERASLACGVEIPFFDAT